MMRSRKGSVTVFLVIFLTGMSVLFAATLGASKAKAIDGTVRSLGPLWTSSLLGEYDRRLLDEYDIFAFYGTEMLAEKKIESLSDYSFDDKDYIEADDIRVELAGYGILLTENLREQIRAAEIVNALDWQRETENDYAGAIASEEGGSVYMRKIENERIIKSLPSYGRVDDGILDRASDFIKNMKDFKSLIRYGTDSYLINAYIGSHFRNLVNANHLEDRYFVCEQEYILCGKLSDEANRKGVRNRIILIREAMNLAYLESDPEKSAAALALGLAMTGGLGGEAAKHAILAAWALAESVNDYKLLIHGRKVPFIKDDASWATDLENVMANTETEYIDTGSDSGNDYEDYIEILLYILGEDARLLRIMDLIQINMKYSYNADFMLADYYVGLGVRMRVNGREYSWNDEY